MSARVMQAMVCAIGISVAALDASAAQTPRSQTPPPTQMEAEWAKDMTVLAIAPDGTWGTATDPSFGRALAKAIVSCKSKYRREIGCGHRSVSVRAGWIFAMRCGPENVIAAGKTLQVAEQAAVDSELSLRRNFKPGIPPCVRVVSVSPNGEIIAPDVGPLLQFVMENGAR